MALTYNRGGAGAGNVARFGVPLTDAAGLARSLRRLARVAGGRCA